jgi:hypothetical protein
LAVFTVLTVPLVEAKFVTDVPPVVDIEVDNVKLP